MNLGGTDDLRHYRRLPATAKNEYVRAIERKLMPRTDHLDMTSDILDAIAWKFLNSEFTGRSYLGWPIERRLDRYLVHQGLPDLVDDGSTFNALLDHVMANIGPAFRSGVLSVPTG